MAVGETLPHCTGTGTSADPYKYSTAQGFKEAIAVANAYVEAAEENLVFDSNSGVIPSSGMRIGCRQLNGKGTIIRNQYLTNSDGFIVSGNAYASGNSSLVDIYNMNFFNMYMLNNNGYDMRFVHAYPTDYGRIMFVNCNFTGIYRGTKINNGSNAAIIRHTNSYSGRDHKEAFTNCTFNFNIVGTSYNATNIWVLRSDFNAFLNNCTICVSGTISGSGVCITDNYSCIGCTFTNSQTNPLKLNRTGNTTTVDLKFNPANSTYNYNKMYVRKVGNTPIRLALTNCNNLLVNRSRFEGQDLSGTCISMQETDSTASDYIYNAQNLANAGFSVGTVIE